MIPVYNHEKFIGDTIGSVINQTYQNWEMLVIDDCSTDNSWEIIQEYVKMDSRIRASRNKENKGLIYNWKFLIDNSKGKYLAFLEGDDFFHKDNLKKKVEIFDKYSDLGMVYCNFSIVDENGGIIVGNHNSFQNVRTYKDEFITPSEYLSSKYHLINSYGQVMIRRSALEKTGYPRTLDPIAKVFLPSDWDFNFRISTQNKVYYIDDVLFNYRKHSSNNSYNAIMAFKHISLLLDEYEKEFAGNKEILNAIKYKKGRYVYSKVIYFLDAGSKRDAWREFILYLKSTKFSLKDFDLNIKLIIRMFFPNFLNVYIRKRYYHQTD
jgi:glycosyltransferase involved in cell wall biosynthesis